MTKEKLAYKLGNLEKATNNLKEALEYNEDNALAIDGTIKRFELVVELIWKTLKIFLESEAVETISPKDVFKKAFQLKWIEEEDVWLAMLMDRNLSAHIYDENKAREIYDHLDDYINYIEKLIGFLNGLIK